jgi:hypothetical protein
MTRTFVFFSKGLRGRFESITSSHEVAMVIVGSHSVDCLLEIPVVEAVARRSLYRARPGLEGHRKIHIQAVGDAKAGLQVSGHAQDADHKNRNLYRLIQSFE